MSVKSFFTYIVVGCVLFAMLCGGSFRIGSLSLRNYMTVFLLAYTIINQKRISNNYITKSYFVFFFTILVCALINGDALNLSFWTGSIISYFIPSFLVYFATTLFCKKCESGVDIIGKLLIFLYIINAIVTILQYYGNPIGWAISRILSSGDLISESIIETHGGESSFVGIAVAAGLFGFVTGNGYFIGSYAPLATMRISQNNIKQIIFEYIVLALGILAAFATQERMALLAVICNILLILFYNFRNRKNSYFLTILLIFCAVAYISENVTDYGRFTMDTDNSDRKELSRVFNEFLNTENVWFGGWSNYMNLFPGKNQHNTFMDTITRYGVVGFIPFCFLFYKVFRVSILSLIMARKNRIISTYIYSSAILLYLFYSLTHGTGLQSGDVTFWLLFALFESDSNKSYILN